MPSSAESDLREPRRDSRDVILDAASDLFNRQDMRTVAIDAIVAHSGVSKATVYRHFRSKDEIVVEFLRRRERFVRERLTASLELSITAKERMLSVFTALERWCARPDFRGSAFTGAAIEFADTGHPAWQVIHEHISFLSGWLRTQAAEAGLRDPESLARQLVILIEGAADLALLEQDASAARYATTAAERLIEAAA